MNSRNELINIIRQNLEKNWRSINKREPHLGCIRCGRRLSLKGYCKSCEFDTH